MDKREFFEAVLSDCSSDEEKVVRLLQLLGYFIHVEGNDYYLSDNASPEDIKTLEKIFYTFSLGEARRLFSPRVICEEKQARSYPNDKSIMDLSFTVSEERISTLIEECFKSVRLGGEAGPNTMEWREFLNGKPPKKVSASFLEPFIAYYVKAASACGVATCYSCDGNHPGGGRVICRSDYPFCIFHKRVWRDVSTRFEIEGDIEKGISINNDSQYDLYYKIYQAAHYMYENRVSYREMKYGAIRELRAYQREMRKNKEKPTDQQYENLFNKVIGLTK